MPSSPSGEPFFGMHASNDGKIMIFGGGVPIKRAIRHRRYRRFQRHRYLDQAVAEVGAAAL